MVGWLVSAMVFFGFVALVVIVYAWGIHWLWRERGKGFAEGWFEVAERQAQGEAARPRVEWKVLRGGEGTGVPDTVVPPGKFTGPDQGTAKPLGPVRYLIPTERE